MARQLIPRGASDSPAPSVAHCRYYKLCLFTGKWNVWSTQRLQIEERYLLIMARIVDESIQIPTTSLSHW